MIELAKTSNYTKIYDVNDNIFLSNENMKDTIISWYEKNNIELKLEQIIVR